MADDEDRRLFDFRLRDLPAVDQPLQPVARPNCDRRNQRDQKRHGQRSRMDAKAMCRAAKAATNHPATSRAKTAANTTGTD